MRTNSSTLIVRPLTYLPVLSNIVSPEVRRDVLYRREFGWIILATNLLVFPTAKDQIRLLRWAIELLLIDLWPNLAKLHSDKCVWLTEQVYSVWPNNCSYYKERFICKHYFLCDLYGVVAVMSGGGGNNLFYPSKEINVTLFVIPTFKV